MVDMTNASHFGLRTRNIILLSPGNPGHRCDVTSDVTTSHCQEVTQFCLFNEAFGRKQMLSCGILSFL